MKRIVRIENLSTEKFSPEDLKADPSIVSVAFLIKQFGGYKFEFETTDGALVPVSIEEFRHRDPETTFLRLGVESAYDSPEEADEAEARSRALGRYSGDHSS